MKKGLLILAVFFSLLIFGQNVKAADWQISELDSMGGIALPGEISGIISLKTDSNNKVYISYCDATNNDLKYITNASGSWISEIVDSGNVQLLNSLAIDSNNKVHIAYLYAEGANFRLKYANNILGVWQTEILDSSIRVAFPSLAIDSNNKMHIAYYDATNEHIKYATNSSGSWIYATLDSTSDNGMYNSLAIDSNNKVHISYFDETNSYLKYVTNSLGAWAIMVIDNTANAGYFSSLVIDSNNKVHIVYLHAGTSYEVKYATNATSDGNWSIDIIDSAALPVLVGLGTYISLDTNNKSHIIYSNYIAADNNKLQYATNTSGSFVKYQLGDTDNVGYPALDVDSKNRTHIAYYDGTTHQLKYTYTPGPSDEITMINDGRNYSAYRKIHAISSLTGSPTEMIVSEKADFSDKTWETYATDKIFKMSSKKGKKTIYVKYRDSWHAESDVVSADVKYVGNPKFVTKKAKKKNEVKIKKKNKKYYARDFNLTFKKYPSVFKNIKRNFLVKRQKKYSKLYADAKNNLLKKYWKITTDFTKYNNSKPVKLKLVFQYTTAEFKALKKKIKGLKEKDLHLKLYNLKSNEWADLSVKHSVKKNTFTTYLNSPFEDATLYYMRLAGDCKFTLI